MEAIQGWIYATGELSYSSPGTGLKFWEIDFLEEFRIEIKDISEIKSPIYGRCGQGANKIQLTNK